MSAIKEARQKAKAAIRESRRLISKANARIASLPSDLGAEGNLELAYLKRTRAELEHQIARLKAALAVMFDAEGQMKRANAAV